MICFKVISTMGENQSSERSTGRVGGWFKQFLSSKAEMSWRRLLEIYIHNGDSQRWVEMKVWRQISGMGRSQNNSHISKISQKCWSLGQARGVGGDLDYSGAKEHRDPKREYSPVLSNEGETMMDICGELPSCQTSFHAEFQCIFHAESHVVRIWDHSLTSNPGWGAGDSGYLNLFLHGSFLACK